MIVPFAGLAVAVWLAWATRTPPRGHSLLEAAFYLVTGLGVTIGFHRLLTHRSFAAAPGAAGRAGYRGVDELRGRRHRLGRHPPPSSRTIRQAGRPAFAVPVRDRPARAAPCRIAHAHVGWLLRRDDPTPPARYAPDMVANGPYRRCRQRSLPCAPCRFRLPVGRWDGPSAAAGTTPLAALLRQAWSAARCGTTSPRAFNSLCHVISYRPFTTNR